jgi:beta-xylosidase
VVVLLSGRPYSLGAAGRTASAIVQAFFPGEEGSGAIASILSGRVAPEGRLPVSVPAQPGGQPSTYLAAPLAQRSEVSTVDPTPAFGFGHGLTYTTFAWSDLWLESPSAGTNGTLRARLTVANTGARVGTEVVQLYLHDPVASVVRPVQRLIGYTRVPLRPGEAAEVCFEIPADLTAFTGRDGVRFVEPGTIELRFAASSTDIRLVASADLTGQPRPVDHHRTLSPTIGVHPR